MAFIYDVDQTKPLKPKIVHDPDESVYYTLRYRAPIWASETEKKQASAIDDVGDIVMPTVRNGFYAECISSGITGTTEPTWGSAVNEQVTDGTVTWKMLTDYFELESGDVISSSSWTADDVGVVMDNDGTSNGDAYVRVTAVPAGATSFTLTNELTILRGIGTTEIINRSITIKIKEK
jgi:hypothetical protein